MPRYLHTLLSIGSLLFSMPTFAGSETAADAERTTVDVFVTSAQAVALPAEDSLDQDGLIIAIHTLDGIARFNAELSVGLDRDPTIAKQQVLRRFKTVNKKQREALQQSAEAVALALQLGLQRYPAIVFDSHWVVYGVLNVQAAIDMYWARRQGQR